MELNIVSDLDLTVSTNQIQLIQHKVKDILGSMNPNKGKCDTSTDETEYVHDSGVGSEISNLTVTKPHLEKKTADIYSYCDTMTPVDLLLTAGRISCTLYSHKTVEKAIKVNAQTSASSRKKNKPKKQDLEWRIDTDSTDNLQINDASPTVLDPYMLHMYTTDSAAQERIIGQGTVCIRPFLFVYISQPHTVLSLHREQQKFETSSYDVLVKGATEDLLIPGRRKA
ncbi:hypothetical protein DPMN_103722 [Dreissena polymorpha]|uniref:Uncharacterized protein n=1 Tax=Dreissena polymorpha TaxID=45954 RepID=A0A9D4K2R5_DREPO|nr:hypothetical protein DPMN_103722 [Dreissena polymorpha]